jgi:hypothetical protein
MIPREKINKVRNYLKKDISAKAFGCEYDPGRKAQTYTLPTNDHTITVRVLEEFFNANEVNEIKTKLKDFRLLEFVRHGRTRQITVTRFGLRLEDFK